MAAPAPAPTEERGTWNSKLGFILAAAGSAVGLGNIWGFPTQVADNGGAAFLIVYALCCVLVGFPVMVAELAIGRAAKLNAVGAFRKLAPGKPLFVIVGLWGVLCGVMILSFYNVIAGWSLGFVFEEVAYFSGNTGMVDLFSDLGNGAKNGLFSLGFMLATVMILVNGVSDGIERATKIMMPALITMMILLIVYVLTLDGATEGLTAYLVPDWSKVDVDLFFSALGQAFFSLSLGMGAIITYGSYLRKDTNIVEAAAYVTLADFSIAFLAGLLIMPTMYLAQANGITIFNADGTLLAGGGLVFSVLPNLFHNLGGFVGFFFGFSFFILLSMAALTSTVSLLEVPVAYMIDEHGLTRKKAAWSLGGFIALISIGIGFDGSWIDTLANIFNNIGLPLGGLLISIFLGYVWKTGPALAELEEGFPGVTDSWFGTVWPIFIKYICPVLILIVFVVTVQGMM